jgi:tetratricopeptide (TPR) repeat protein
VVHYLLTTPGVREKAPALFAALGDGVPFARACEAVLGTRQGLLLEAARRAVEQKRFLTARIATDGSSQSALRPAPMTEEEADGLLVSLALAAGRPELAAKATTPAQRGLVALSQGKHDEARKWLEEAVASGSSDPAAAFELAMLLRDGKKEPERVTALLRQTIERNPNHAEAHFILGLQAAARGDEEGAVDYYQQAARILPRQANFWHALALTLERTGRLAEASHAAMRCRLAARNAAEREMAAAIDRLIREPAMAALVKKPAVQVPESWKGLQGDASLAGDLVHFDCGAMPPLATVVHGDERLLLRVSQPNAIRVSGTGSIRHTFSCGEQKRAVVVEYRRGSLELTGIEFR